MYGPCSPSSSSISAAHTSGNVSSECGYTVMNLPLPARSAYLEFRRASRAGDGTHLKGSRWARQWAATRSSTDSALSAAADMWSFHPWAGSRSPSGLKESQSPRRERVHPSGAPPRTGA